VISRLQPRTRFESRWIPVSRSARLAWPASEADHLHSGLVVLFLALTIATIPAENLIVVGSFGTLTRLLALIATGLAAMDCIRLGRVRPMSPAFAALCVYVLWSAATWLWTVSPELTAARLWSYCQKIAFAWTIFELGDSEDHRRVLVGSYVAGALAASALAIRAFANGAALSAEMSSRYGITGADPNDLALALVIAAPMAVYLAMTGSNKLVRAMSILSIPLIFMATLVTGSRGGLLALLAASAVILALYIVTPRGRIIAVCVFAGLALSVYLGSRMLPSAIVERYSGIGSEVTSGTMSNRTVLWRAALELIANRPFNGYGAGAYPDAAESLSGVNSVAHNTYLSVAAEQGLIGLGLLLLVIAVAGISIRRMGGHRFKLWAATLAAWGVGVNGLTWENSKPTWLILALFSAYCVSQASQPGIRKLSIYARTSNQFKI
jgi:O-antigen ligase